MSCFNELANRLSTARKYQASARISFLDRKTWGELFDQDEKGLIRPQEAAGLFPPALFASLLQGDTALADLSPDHVERLISRKYREYKQAGFMEKLWMWFAEPVNKYQKVYTLVKLRKLEEQCRVVGEHASEMAGLHNPDLPALGNFFNAVMGLLGTCLSSLFPGKPGFFTRIFGNRKMFCHIEDLGQFRKEAYRVLQDTVGKSYATLAKKAHACSSKKELTDIQDEIKNWYQVHADNITRNTSKSSIDEKYKNKYQGFTSTLLIKSRLLSGIAEAALNKAESGISDSLSPSIQEDIDRTYSLLSTQLANIKDGCTLQVRDHQCLFSNTYVLDDDYLFSDWKLLYYRTPQSIPEEINIQDVPGLGNLLSQQKISASAASRLLVEYHHGVMPPAPVRYRAAISDADPEKRSENLLQYYSRQMEQKLLEEGQDNNLNLEKMRRHAGELHACLDYLKEKNETCIPIHASLEEAGLLYTQLARDIANKAGAIKRHCAERIVYHQDQDPGIVMTECITHLQKEYRLLQDSEDFARLFAVAKNLVAGLKKMADAEIRKLRELARSLSMIRMKQPDEWSLAGMLGILPEKEEWEEHISKAFAEAWENMPGQEDANTRKILNDTEKDCFFHYMQLGKTLPELQKIYGHARKLKTGYLNKLQQETRTLVISTQPEKPEDTMRNFYWDLDINTAISELREKFDRNLKFHPERMTIYTELLNLLVMRVEGSMWGMWDKDTLMDKRCGLLFAPISLVEEEAHRLSWSHFIYTPDNEIYYYCKQKNTFEKCCPLDSYDMESFNEMFPNKTYIKFLEKDQLKGLCYIISCTYSRDEDRITCKVGRELAEKEINNLTRTISGFYHPDKHPDGEKWQKLINSRKSDALARLDKLLRDQPEIVRIFELVSKNLSHLSLKMRTDLFAEFIPDWIKRRDHGWLSDMLGKIAACYYSIDNDKTTEKFLVSGKKHMAEINEAREKSIKRRREHEKYMQEHAEIMKQQEEESLAANEQEHRQPKRAAIANPVKHQEKNLGSLYPRGLKATISGHRPFHRRHNRISYAGMFYSAWMNKKISGDDENEFSQRKSYSGK